MSFTVRSRLTLTPPQSLALLLTLLFAGLYFFTAPRVNVSYADSDLLTIIGYQLGVAHPPGYPYLIFLLHIATHLPLPFSIAFRANLVSLVFHSATLFLLFLAQWHLLRGLRYSNRLSLVAATVGTVSLGSVFLFWLYSIVAEKYALNDFFIAASLYCLILLATKRAKFRSRTWKLLLLTVSLALGHHHTFLLYLPAFCLFGWFYRHELRPLLKPFLAIFFTVQLFFTASLFFLNAQAAPVSWNFEPTATGFLRHLTRREFTGYQVIEGKYRGIYLDPVSFEEIVAKIPAHSLLLLQHFGAFALFLVLLGLLSLRSLPRHFKLPLLLMLLSTTVFIPLYLDWPADLSTQAIRIRMYLAAWLPLTLLVGLGFASICRRVQAYHPKFLPLFLTISLFLLSAKLSTTYRQADLSRFSAVSDHYRELLQSVPPHTLLSCLSDTSCFATLYAQKVDGIRPDVFILPHGNQIIKRQLQHHPEFTTLNYPENPELYLDYLTTTLRTRPVYLLELQQIYYRLLGMNYGFFHYQPQGYYGRLTADFPDSPPQVNYTFSQSLAAASFPPIDHYRLQLKASLAQKHLLNARVFSLRRESQDRVDRELHLAGLLIQGLPELYQHDFTQSVAAISTSSGFDLYVPDRPEPTRDQILDQASAYFHQGDDQAMYLGLTNLLWHNPTDLEVRQTLSWLYETRGFGDLALVEYRHLLQFDPGNAAAITALDRLTQTSSSP